MIKINIFSAEKAFDLVRVPYAVGMSCGHMKIIDCIAKNQQFKQVDIENCKLLKMYIFCLISAGF